MAGGGRGPEAYGFERVASAATPSLFGLSIASLGTAVAGFALSYALSQRGGGTNLPRLGPMRLGSTDEGEDIARAHGVAARVPGVVLWASDTKPRDVVGRVGKRREVVGVAHYADLCLGFSRHLPGRFSHVERIFFNGRTIYDARAPITLSTTFEGAAAGGAGGVIFNWTEYQVPDQRPPGFQSMRDWSVSIESEPELADPIAIASFAPVSVNISAGVDRVVALRITTSAPHGLAVGLSRLIRIAGVTATGAYTQLPRVRWFLATALSATTIEIPFAADRLSSIGTASGGTVQVARLFNADGAPRLDVFDPDGNTVSVTTNGVPAITLPPYAGGGLTNDRTNLRLDVWQVLRQIRYPASLPAMGQPPAAFPNPGDSIDIVQPRLGHDRNIVEDGLSAYDFPYAIARTAGGSGIEDQEPSPRLVSQVGETNAPAYRNQVCVFIEDVNTSTFGSQNVPNVEAVVRCTDTTRAATIQSICEFAGIDAADVDVSQVAGTNRGCAVAGVHSGADFLGELALAWGLAVQDTGTGLRFLPRESCPVVTIPEGDWIGGDLDNPRFQIRRADERGGVRTLTLKFVDDEKDQASGSVVDIDPAQVGGSDESIAVNVSMSAAEARIRAQQLLREANAMRLSTDGRLPPSYDFLQENDIVETTIRGVPMRWRLMTVDIGTDGSVAVAMVQEPRIPTIPEVAVAEVIEFAASNLIQGTPRLAVEAWTGIRVRDDEDPERGIYVAATPFSGGGSVPAAVLVSADGGENWRIAGRLDARATMGFVRGAVSVEPLSYAPAKSWDDASTFEVELYQGELESIPEDDAREGRSNLALVGEEVLAFRTATATSKTTATLSGFLRGLNRSGTSGHVGRERFVLLSDAPLFVPLRPDESGTDLLVAVQPIGLTLDESNPRSLFVPMLPDREFVAEPVAPSWMEARSESDGSVSVRWAPLDRSQVERYEIRPGSVWHGAPAIWCGTCTEARLDLLAPGTRSLMVCALYRGGLWSQEVATETVVVSTPDNSQQPAAIVDVYDAESVAGTLSGLTRDDSTGHVGITDGEYSGTLVSQEIDAESRANWTWLADIDTHEEDQRPVDELPEFAVGSTEGYSWHSYGREPSPNYPGHDLDRSIADIEAEVGELSIVDLEAAGWASYGKVGNYGLHTRATLEARFYDAEGSPGSWTEYERFRPGRRLASKMQLRITLERGDPRWQRWLSAVRGAVRA